MDTGASILVITEKIYGEPWNRKCAPTLMSTQVKLRTYIEETWTSEGK